MFPKFHSELSYNNYGIYCIIGLLYKCVSVFSFLAEVASANHLHLATHLPGINYSDQLNSSLS